MNSIPGWSSPLPLTFVASADSNSYLNLPAGHTAIPLYPHPGSFGFVRKHHTHEGVDLYAPEGTPVMAMEDGCVVRIEDFTGPKANTPWWLDTQAVFVEGKSGVIVYGELAAVSELTEGMKVISGQVLGHLTPVLRHNKGRPGCMLHLELHAPGTRQAPAWEDQRPDTLRDPTPYLLEIVAAAEDLKAQKVFRARRP